MKKPNILQLIGEFTSGGAETIVVNLTNILKRDNWNIIVSARKDGPLSSQLVDREGIYIIEKKGTIDINYIFKLVSLVRKHNIQVIHSHLFGNDFYGFIVAKLCGAKIIQTIHGMDSINSKKRILAYNLMAPFVDWIVTVSESLYKEMSDVVITAKGKFLTINNGIDIEKYLHSEDVQQLRDEIEIKDSYPVIGAIGNVKHVKGYDTLIRSARSIVDLFPRVKFLIFGEIFNSAYKGELDRLVLSLNLRGHIEFMGFRTDAYRFLPLFDLYVLPSRSEGLSIALLEAMASGRPIVATKVGGTPDIIRDGETGLLVPPEDPYSLANAIIQLLKNQTSAKTIGEQAQLLAEKKFSINSMTQKYLALYDEVLNVKYSRS